MLSNYIGYHRREAILYQKKATTSCTRGRFFYAQKKRRPIENLCEAHRTGARMAKRKGAGLGRRREKRAPDEGCRSGSRKGGTHGTRFPRGKQIMREDYDTNPDTADQGECGICGKQGAGA